MSLAFTVGFGITLFLSYFGAVTFEAAERLFNALSRRIFVKPAVWQGHRLRAAFFYPLLGFYWLAYTRSGRRGVLVGMVRGYALGLIGSEDGWDANDAQEIIAAAESWDVLQLLNEKERTR